MADSWIGNDNGVGLWNAGGNWSSGSAPTSNSDVATIAEAGSYQVAIVNTDPSYKISSLTLGGTGSAPTLAVQGQLSVQKLITLSNGANLDVGAAGTASASRLTVGAGSSVVDLGSLDVSGALAGSGAVAVNGGSLFANEIAGINTYTLTNAATMTISNSVSSSGAIVFGDGTPDTLNIDEAGSRFGAAITGFSGGDVIDLGWLGYSSAETAQYNNSTLTISKGGTPVFTFTDFDNLGSVSLADDGAGGTEIVTCFLAGTRILAEGGEIAVEALAVGDRIATLVDGAVVYRPVIWVGHRSLDAAAVQRVAVIPVRILSGAFSRGIPARDLLVTPEHCIFVGGCLIPARMLVNGSSIVEDRTIRSFDVYHVELEMHAVLLAEGLAAESYLDTGNRRAFPSFSAMRRSCAAAPGPAHKSWGRDACARLATDRETVEPIWAMLAARASRLGMRDQRRPVTLLHDPRLRILLDSGDTVAARGDRHGRHVFQIPLGTRPLRLLSRVSVPAAVIGPFVDDRRSLGVQVRCIAVWDGSRRVDVEAKDIDLAGWHAAEQGSRWTDGDAALDLPVAFTSTTFIEIHVVATLPYQEEILASLAA